MRATLPSLRVPPGEVTGLQSALLRRQLRRLAAHHPHYRTAWRQLGIEVADIRDIPHLEILPVTSKRDLAATPESYRLDPQDGDLLWDVVYTTGSSGPPTPIYQSAYDFRTVLFSQRRMADIRGLSHRDRIANLFPVTGHPNGSWVRVTNGAQAIGAQVVTGLSGARVDGFPITRRMAQVAEVVAAAQPTVLWGVGSYLRRLLQHMADISRGLSSVRMVVCSGEGLTDRAEARILGLLAALGSAGAVVSRGFGASELQCSLVPCEPGGPLHNPAPELHLLQVVDDAGAVLPPGAPGWLCLTHLNRRGTALVRYLLGDRVVLDDQPCQRCGRAGGSLVRHHGRDDGMAKVRGNLVDLLALGRAVQEVEEVREHRAVLVTGPDGATEELLVEVALPPGVDETEALRRVATVARAAAGVRVEVRSRTPDDLYRPDHELKPSRVVVRPRGADPP